MNEQRYSIDLARCTGCQVCSIACKDRANLPDNLDWNRVQAEEGGTYPKPTLTYRVMHCFHCVDPVCTNVCPTAAIYQEKNGLVLIDGDLCTGCGNCIEVCPFSAIVMLPGGVASKCDGCADELAQGWDPTCVRACLMRALSYGSAAIKISPKRIIDSEFDDHGIGPRVDYLRWNDD